MRKQISYFLHHKVYMVSLILAAIVGYGYEITHTTMGIDDVCIEAYFEDGLGVAIGRWPFFLLNKIFHVTEYTPFLLDFIAVLLLMLAAILWSALIRNVLKKELPTLCYIVFSAMFMDYSLIAEVFVYYLQNGIAIIYCLTALSLFGFYYCRTRAFTLKQEIPYVASMSAMMCVAISFYESAANVFLFGVLLLMLLDGISKNQMGVHKLKGCFYSMLLMVRVLLYAIVGRTIITKLCMVIFGIEPYNYRSFSSVLWILKHPGRLLTIGLEFLRDYVVVGVEYYPIRLFVIATILYAVMWVVLVVKQKNLYIALLGIATYLSLFALSIAQGEVIQYRANQTLSVFVAAVLMATCYWVLQMPKVWLKGLGLIFIFAMVYNSIFDLNQWFALEYKRNQLELEEVHRIAYELSSNYDIESKPVVFVGEYRVDKAIQKEYSMDSSSKAYGIVQRLNNWMEIDTPEVYPYTQVLAHSFLNWSLTSFSEYEGYNRELIRLFEKEGLSLIWGGNELYEKGVKRIEDQNRFPKNGYIREYHDMILVRF